MTVVELDEGIAMTIFRIRKEGKKKLTTKLQDEKQKKKLKYHQPVTYQSKRGRVNQAAAVKGGQFLGSLGGDSFRGFLTCFSEGLEGEIYGAELCKWPMTRGRCAAWRLCNWGWSSEIPEFFVMVRRMRDDSDVEVVPCGELEAGLHR